MVDEVIRKIEALGLSNESTAHPEIHAILRDIGGILRVLYDAVVETGTATHGAIPVVVMRVDPMEVDSKESSPKGEG